MGGKLKIGDKEIRYKVRRGKSSKYLSLKLKPNLELEVILPNNSKIDVKKVLEKKRSWIERKYAEMLNKKRIFDENKILYRGDWYDIKLIPNARSSYVELNDETRIITVYASEKDPSFVLRKWMQERTRNYVREEVNKHTKTLGVNFSTIYIRSMKKWGGCSRKGNLSFNWQLIALPEKLAEYVIIHEVVHLVEFDHSKDFHRKILSICPDYREREKMLKKYLSIPSAISLKQEHEILRRFKTSVTKFLNLKMLRGGSR